MSRTRSVLEARRAHILSLYAFIGLLSLICVGLMYGWSIAPKRILVDIPPDIRTGAIQQIDQRQPPSIYQFGHYIFQQLNRWPSDGSKDYPARINALRPYLTPACYQNRLEDFEKRNSGAELHERERYVSEMPGRGYSTKRVFIESSESWAVLLDMQIMEIYRGERVKDTFVRYPLRIVGYHGDPESNRYGLMLDCFVSEPQRIEEDSLDSTAKNEKSADAAKS